MAVQYVEGMIFQDSKFIKGHLGFENGTIQEFSKGSSPKGKEAMAKGVVFPLMTNCHTHIGDAIARGRDLSGTVEQLVAPPDGLKFQILRQSRPNELVAAMRQAITEMLNTGTGSFFDFREEGLTGVELLGSALEGLPIKSLVLGRPKGLNYSHDEIIELLRNVDGLGLSSITDWDYSELEKIAAETKRKGKLFALHASERHREDLDLILDLNPDFLVHMTYGSDSDYEQLAELGIPVVLCLRSNIFFNNIPDINKMLSKGVTLVLGSDNAMINSSNLFEEVRVCNELVNCKGNVKPKIILDMVTKNTNNILGSSTGYELTPGQPSDFMVLDIPFDEPEVYMMRGVRLQDFKFINIGNCIWKKNIPMIY